MKGLSCHQGSKGCGSAPQNTFARLSLQGRERVGHKAPSLCPLQYALHLCLIWDLQFGMHARYWRNPCRSATRDKTGASRIDCKKKDVCSPAKVSKAFISCFCFLIASKGGKTETSKALGPVTAWPKVRRQTRDRQPAAAGRPRPSFQVNGLQRARAVVMQGHAAEGVALRIAGHPSEGKGAYASRALEKMRRE